MNMLQIAAAVYTGGELPSIPQSAWILYGALIVILAIGGSIQLIKDKRKKEEE